MECRSPGLNPGDRRPAGRQVLRAAGMTLKGLKLTARVVGRRLQGARETGKMLPGAGRRLPGAGRRPPGAGWRLPVAGRRLPGAGRSLPGAGRSLPGAREADRRLSGARVA